PGEQPARVANLLPEPGKIGRRGRRRWRNSGRSSRSPAQRRGVPLPPVELILDTTVRLIVRTAVRSGGLVQLAGVLGQFFHDILVGQPPGGCEHGTDSRLPSHVTPPCQAGRKWVTRFSASKKFCQVLRWLASVFRPAVVNR